MKQMSVEELLRRQSELNNALDALEKSGASAPSIVDGMKAELAQIATELESRKSEIFAKGLETVIAKAVAKAMEGKEFEGSVTLQLTIEQTPEGLSTTLSTAKKARAASTGGGGGGARGERKGARVTLNDGTVFEKDSAADALRELKARKIVAQEMGETDAATRVLNRLVGNGIIKSWEPIEIAKEAPVPAAGEATEAAPAQA